MSESRKSAEKIRHLNGVLRAIRNVNQLIVRERNSERLIARACDLLIETRGYNAAWIALGDNRGAKRLYAQAGWQEDFSAAFSDLLDRGEWPRCHGGALSSEECFVITETGSTCGDCPLSSGYGHGHAVVTALRYDDDVLGLLGVSFPAAQAVDDQETSLLAEVAGDLAFALHDIESERLRVESEARLEAAVSGGQVGLWDLDLASNAVVFSDEWKAQLGHRPDEIADSYGEWERRVHPDDLEPTLQCIRLAQKPPYPPYQAEFRLLHKDGSYRWICARGRVSVDDQGRPTKMQGTHVDVTERRLEEEKHRQAQQVAHIGHWELEAYDQAPSWSDEIFRIFGLEPGQAEPSFTAHDTIIHPDEWPTLDSAVRAGFEEGTPFDLVFKILRPGGQLGWMHAIGYAQEDQRGRVAKLFGTAQDITAQRRAEEELRQFEWLLDKEEQVHDRSQQRYGPPYSDVTALNTAQVIRDAMDTSALENIARDLMDLLDTSVAVYESNGDYAYGVFDSVWCRLLDSASFALCRTEDTEQALGCGKWLCHENCWNDSAKAAIESGAPTDIECVGGIRLYAVPIRAADDIIGAVNIGYGTPPRDVATLDELAARFELDREQLDRASNQYKPRPRYIIDVAKRRCESIARMIGETVERQRAEQALASREAFVSALLQAIPSPLFYKDHEGRYLGFNKAFERFFGASREQLVGRSVFGINPPELAEIYAAKDAELLSAGGVQTYESQVKGADGRLHDVIFHKATFEGARGEIAGLIGTILDISETKLQQERLREQQERAQLYLDVAAVMLVGLDRDGAITLINRRGCEVLGVEHPRVVLGQGWFQFIPPDERDAVRELHHANISGGKVAHRRIEGRVLTAAGELRRVVWHNAVIRNAQKEIVGTLSSGEDITERRALEVKLAQADRLSSMGTLAAGVAHEINNPLSYILYNLESLSEDLPTLIGAMRQFQERLLAQFGADTIDEIAGSAARKMNPLVLDDIQNRFKDALEGTYRIRDVARGLGTFSRVEEDQVVPVNLTHVIDVALSMAANEIKYRARLFKDYGKNLPTVLASEGRLSQVFLNLVINASHAIDEGDLENNEIRVKTWAEGEQVCAQVRDTGSGIAAENQGKIFEPFFTTKGIGVGSGLGLAISKGIVEGFGGTIEVESELGTGTCFTIRLPVRAAKQATVEPPAEADEGPKLRGRVLVVDDEAGLRAAMVRMLREHETIQASSGAEAREILEHDQAFDVIISDMMMPDISGMELHQWLAETHPALAAELIFVTGGAFTPLARKYLGKISNIRLEKPFNSANFKKIVGDRIQMAKGTKKG